MNKSLFVKTAVAFALAAPLLASAESNINIGGAPNTATARLDFRVIVPRVLLLQVGTLGVNNIDLVEFNLGTIQPGAGGQVARTNGPAVPVRVLGNAGNIGLTATTTGALSDGAGNTISFAKISATTSDTLLPHPALVDGAAGASTPIVPNIGTRVTDLTANWTFQYLNDTVVAAGTYGGVGTNNGRVTYTASMP